MSPRPTHRRARPAGEHQVLTELARLLDRAHGPADGNLVVTVTGRLVRPCPTDELELGLLDLGDRHPLDALLGWSAPPGCSAVGVRATGRAWHLDDAGSPDAPAQPVAFAYLASRRGVDAGVLRRGDRVEPLPGAGVGLVADACRRAMGCPTAPPPHTTGRLLTTVWLDRLLGQAAGGTGPASWADAARAHPALDRRALRAWARHGAPHPRALARRAVEHAHTLPWSALRADPAATAVLDQAAPPAEVAAWMDDGAFARWMLAGFPPVAQLLADLRALLPTGVADAVSTAVAAAEAAET